MSKEKQPTEISKEGVPPLKCPYCDFTTPALVTLKNGDTRDGYDKLNDHVHSKHWQDLPTPMRVYYPGGETIRAANRDQEREEWR